jgi:uncharacterized OsmC-like protein
LNVDLKGSTIGVTKFMQTQPRRIGKITIEMQMNANPSQKERIILERTAMNCPVYLSLNPEIEKEVTITWKE